MRMCPAARCSLMPSQRASPNGRSSISRLQAAVQRPLSDSWAMYLVALMLCASAHLMALCDCTRTRTLRLRARCLEVLPFVHSVCVHPKWCALAVRSPDSSLCCANSHCQSVHLIARVPHIVHRQICHVRVRARACRCACVARTRTFELVRHYTRGACALSRNLPLLAHSTRRLPAPLHAPHAAVWRA